MPTPRRFYITLEFVSGAQRSKQITFAARTWDAAPARSDQKTV
jgi:hypothetical protein